MAAEGAAESLLVELETEANNWAVRFYAHQALRAFRAGNSQDFRELRDVLAGTPVAGEGGKAARQGSRALLRRRPGGRRPFLRALDRLCFFPAVLARPVALEEPIQIQLRIIQILSRLEEGERGPSSPVPGAAPISV